MAQQQTLLTAEEFFRQYSHRDGRYELVQGRVVVLAPPRWEHGEVAMNLGSPLHVYVRRNDLGRVVVESGYWIERHPDTVRGPDVSFVRKERLPAEGRIQSFFEGPPDLAVEVVSPSDTASSLEAKVHEYLQNGVRRVWVVYVDSRRVAVHHPDGSAQWYSGDAVLEDPDLLPGFSLPLPVIFDL